MRVGTICFAIKRGLGYLAKAFYDNGVVTDPIIMHHGRIKTQYDWYPNAINITTRPFLNNEVKAKIREMDLMLFFETPFEWEIINYCRDVGVKTALMPMYECTHKGPPAKPDLFLCPSLLDMNYYPNNSVFIPIPVDPELSPWRLREKAEVFIHNGGYLGIQGREGTLNVITAMRYVKSPLKLIVRSQERIPNSHIRMCSRDSRIEYNQETIPLTELYATADVAVGAQIWNGCSLPLQEAYASGLLVMNTDRYPVNTWLPNDPLIPVERYDRGGVGGNFNEIDVARVSPRAIAAKMDEWYGKDISFYSFLGKEWAAENSWEKLKPYYVEALTNAL